MPKNTASAVAHSPLGLILTSRAKIAVLRELWRAGAPLSRREIARRAAMAYHSVEQALADLLVARVVEEIGDAPHRLTQLSVEHRLGPSLAALFRSEADFFPALRVALRAVAGQAPAGLIAVAITGAVAGGSEAPGEPLELVLVAIDAAAARHWSARYAGQADEIGRRFGVPVRVIAYDRQSARSLWAKRTPTAERVVHRAETLIGVTLLEAVSSGA